MFSKKVLYSSSIFLAAIVAFGTIIFILDEDVPDPDVPCHADEFRRGGLRRFHCRRTAARARLGAGDGDALDEHRVRYGCSHGRHARAADHVRKQIRVLP